MFFFQVSSKHVSYITMQLDCRQFDWQSECVMLAAANVACSRYDEWGQTIGVWVRVWMGERQAHCQALRTEALNTLICSLPSYVIQLPVETLKASYCFLHIYNCKPQHLATPTDREIKVQFLYNDRNKILNASLIILGCWGSVTTKKSGIIDKD